MATKIPGVKELGKKGMAVLGKKLFNMSKGEQLRDYLSVEEKDCQGLFSFGVDTGFCGLWISL